MSTQNPAVRSGHIVTANVRIRRIVAHVLAPTSPLDQYIALGAYANELADLFNFNPPTHAASGRKVS